MTHRKRFRLLTAILILLSIVMVWVVYKFKTTVCIAFIDHPQFGYFDIFDAVIEQINSKERNTYFSLYFYLDFVWAAFLLLWLNIRARKFEVPNTGKVIWCLTVFSILAYILDVMENTGYLCRGLLLNPDLLNKIVSGKTAAYGLVIAFYVIIYYLHIIKKSLGDIWKSIKASLVSIIAIGLLGFLSTKMEQGSTVIIHLLQSASSLPLALIMINLLALACAHYPDYLYKYFYPDDDKSVEWGMYPMFLTRKTGMGLVYYKESQKTGETTLKEQVTRQLPKNTGFFDHFRKIVGGLLLITWIYVLFFVAQKYIWPDLPIGFFALLVLILFFVFNDYVGEMRGIWNRHYDNNFKIKDKKSNKLIDYRYTFKRKDFPAPIPFLMDTMLICAGLTVFGYILATYFAINKSWVITWWFVMITAFFNVIVFVLFQHFRSLLRIFPFPPFFQQHPLVILKEDYYYLKLFAAGGFFALGTFIYFSFHPPQINALGFILMWMYLVYGLVVILIKHRIYYLQPKTEHSINRLRGPEIFFDQYFPITIFFLFSLFIFSGKVGNGLHRVTIKPEKGSPISMTSYCEAINNRSLNSPTYYLVASYGGGLRATAWTMLILEYLQDSIPKFLDQTLAMSGVSGGFLGLSMYSAIHHEYESKEKRDQVIDSLSRHNILSIDVAYMLAYDLLREIPPYFPNLGKDRAIRSMKEYSCLIQPKKVPNENLFYSTYRDYWAESYLDEGYVPVLIGNTTGTHGRSGVAFSISTHDMTSIFPGADDILDHSGNFSLTYLGATSTTERFPFFSPAAQVEGKGYYVDGGYFENSGLLSLMNFYDYISKYFNIASEENFKILLIINSKEDYVKNVLGSELLAPEKDVSQGELSSILNTVSDIDILPHALEARLKQKYGQKFIPIYLPYPIQENDVLRAIGDKPKDPIALNKRIKESNKRIDAALEEYGSKDRLIPPALARVLSDPAFDYMKAMLRHEELDTIIQRIKK